MTFLKLAGALVLTVGIAAAQATPGAQSGPGQTTTPGTPSGAQAGQQPALTTNPGGSQAGQQPGQTTTPGTPAAPAESQPGQMTTPESQPGQAATPATPSGSAAGQTPGTSSANAAHPGFPAGPGMIEGCLSQAGSGYSVRPSEGGGPAFTLQVDPQQMQNASLQHDMSKSVGMQVKVYGYPANAGGNGSPAAAAPRPGSPEENAGIQGQASGAPPTAGSQQPAAPAGGAMAQGQAVASGSAGSHVLELTEFIPLNKPCGTGTSQAPPKTGASQSAAE